MPAGGLALQRLVDRREVAARPEVVLEGRRRPRLVEHARLRTMIAQEATDAASSSSITSWTTRLADRTRSRMDVRRSFRFLVTRTGRDWPAAPRGGRRQAEVLVGAPRGHPAPRRAHEALLDQEGLQHVLDGAALLAERRRQGLHADRPAVEALDDRQDSRRSIRSKPLGSTSSRSIADRAAAS